MKQLLLLTLLFSPQLLADDAYRTQLDELFDNRITLVDGSIIHLTSDTIERGDYQDSVVVFRDGLDWSLCHDGHLYSIEIQRDFLNDEKHEPLDLTYREIIKLEECR